MRDGGGPRCRKRGIASYSLEVQKETGDSVKLSEKSRKALLGMTTVACGTLGFILLRWTPTTGTGILAYVVLLAGLIVMAIALSSRKRGGYWSGKPEDH